VILIVYLMPTTFLKSDSNTLSMYLWKSNFRFPRQCVCNQKMTSSSHTRKARKVSLLKYGAYHDKTKTHCCVVGFTHWSIELLTKTLLNGKWRRLISSSILNHFQSVAEFAQNAPKLHIAPPHLSVLIQEKKAFFIWL
jgi:hypothetical protein